MYTVIFVTKILLLVRCTFWSLNEYLYFKWKLFFWLASIKALYSRKDTNLVLSRVARFYATTEQKLIYSFWNALRIRRKINQLHQSLCYASSIYYTTQNNPWICRYRFNGKVFLIFSVLPLKHVKFKKKYSRVSYI
jgi:hypothetical protein